jgi:hypothetical protein
MDLTKINISASMVEVIEALETARKGGFAVLKDYVSTSNRTEPEVSDITFNSRFSYENLLTKKSDLLASIRFEDLTIKGEKLLSLDVEAQKKQFIACKTAMVESIEKTLAGVRDDAQRVAHDTFYQKVCEGVKIHLQTIKGANGTELVLQNGLPIAESIMVSGLEVGRKIKTPGVYKVVNSGAKVLMDKCIEKALKEKGFRDIKTFSLKKDNFSSLYIDKMEIS